MTTGKGFHRYDSKSKRNERKFDVVLSEYKKISWPQEPPTEILREGIQ